MAFPDRPTDDQRTSWKVAIVMFLVGAATILGTLPLPEPDTSDHTALAVLGVVQLAFGAGLRMLGPRTRLLRLVPFAGILVVGAVVAVARPMGGTPFFYLWPILWVAYFAPRRELVVALGLFYVSYLGALAASVEVQTRAILYVSGVMSFTLAALVVHTLRSRLDVVMAELRRSAASDPLTGLLNRRGLDPVFERGVRRAARAGTPLSLVIVDLDHFKQVNDRYGHAAGDEVLRTLAAVLRDHGRGGDAIARTGGEEFVIVLNDCDAAGALRYVERVAHEPRLAAGPSGPLSLSAGVAELGPDAATPEALMLAADRVLYAAKAAGRGRVAVHGGGTAPETLRPLAAA